MDVGFYGQLFLAHIFLSGTAIACSFIVGLGLGIVLQANRQIANGVITFVNIAYTIPSIAFLGFLLPFTGVGDTTAIIALVVYGLLPIVRSTYEGLQHVRKEEIEGAQALGLSRWQTLFLIQGPLALPEILTGVQTMAVMTIALTAIASFVGAGGLGVAIYRGITLHDMPMTVTGSILVAFLAILVDRLLALLRIVLVEKHGCTRLSLWLDKSINYIYKNQTKCGALFLSLVLLGGGLSYGYQQYVSYHTIRVASKPTTEGYLLGELLKQVIERKTHLHVELYNGIGGGTSNIQPGMVSGEYDLYPEYTGTAWQVVLGRKDPYKKEKFNELQSLYHSKYGLTWVGMYGFNDTYGLAVRKDLAERYHLHTYSDLARISPQLRFGAEYDFFGRPDGYPGLISTYPFRFGQTLDMDNGLKYTAIRNGKIDAMTVFTTDGQIKTAPITVLVDDKHFYPSYEAGTVVSERVLARHPELRQALESLTGKIKENDMIAMNYQVEVEHKSPASVISQWLDSHGF